jgi:plastocyanin
MEGITQIGSARRALAAAVLAGAAIVGAPGGSEAAAPKLTGTVGPGFTISLKTAAGQKVTSLKAGTYTITVNDRSRIHDFRLRGPGLNKVFSSVSAVGTKQVTVKLRAGKYQFTCQPHAAAMHGAFTVR